MCSLWLMLSPWIIRTLTLPPLLASLVLHNFRRYHKPTIYLPQNNHHTYLLWHFHSHFEIYFHATFHHSVYYDMLHHFHITFAWSCSWHRSCGLVEILVLRFVIPVACTYSEPLCNKVGAWGIYWLSSLWVAVGDERWFFSYQSIPLGAGA